MSGGASPVAAEATAALIGRVDLVLPADWFDVLDDFGSDEREATFREDDAGADAAAAVRFAALVAETFPEESPGSRAGWVEGMMAWRAALLARGLLAHGVISCPAEAANGAAHLGETEVHHDAVAGSDPVEAPGASGVAIWKGVNRGYRGTRRWKRTYDEVARWRAERQGAADR